MPRSTAEATDKKRKIAQLLRQRTTWTCNVCTYENPPSKFKCKVSLFYRLNGYVTTYHMLSGQIW